MEVLLGALSLVGEFEATVRGADDRVVLQRVYHNTATSFLRSAVAQWLIGTNNTGYNPVSPPNYIALGNGSPTPPNTGPNPADTALWAEIASSRKICTARQITNGYYAQFTTVWTVNDPRGAFTEAGLLDAASGGNLWAHVSLSGVSLSDGQTLTGVWRILVQGS